MAADHNNPKRKRPPPVPCLHRRNQVFACGENELVATVADFSCSTGVGENGFPAGNICMEAVGICGLEVAEVGVEGGKTGSRRVLVSVGPWQTGVGRTGGIVRAEGQS